MAKQAQRRCGLTGRGARKSVVLAMLVAPRVAVAQPAPPASGRQADGLGAGNAAITSVDLSGTWNFTPSGRATIVSHDSGLVADVYGAATSDGAQVVQCSGNGGANQQCQFVPA